MCTKAPTIGAMLWQNVNRWRKIRGKWKSERERDRASKKEPNTTISSDFIHVLLVNLILTIWRYTHTRTVQPERKADCLCASLSKTFLILHHIFRIDTHIYSSTAKLSIYPTQSIDMRVKASVSVVPFDFFQFNTFSIANTCIDSTLLQVWTVPKSRKTTPTDNSGSSKNNNKNK